MQVRIIAEHELQLHADRSEPEIRAATQFDLSTTEAVFSREKRPMLDPDPSCRSCC